MVNFRKAFEFGSKAETLERLSGRLTKSTIPDFFAFSVADWRRGDHSAILDRFEARFGTGPVMIRSSARSEDHAESAMAGAFRSVPVDDPRSREAVECAVEEVIESFASHHARRSSRLDPADDQLIAQAMIRDVLVSGVLFTQDLNTGAPYYVINYDDQSGATDTVTSGSGYTNRTLYVFRDAWDRLSSERFQHVLEAIREIEEITDDPNLDVEFALDGEYNVHVFQVRRITTHPNWNRGQSLLVSDALTRLEESLGNRYAALPGDSEHLETVLSNMSDWNPAEMIGTTPRPLALSLYRFLITDRVWRVARHMMGYHHRPGTPLMLSLGGQPYIDVRESFYSFLPEGLSDAARDKLVKLWLQRLRENPGLHDKVEFDVAITAYAPDFDRQLDTRYSGCLDLVDRKEFRSALKSLTNDLIAQRRASIDAQMGALDRLERLRTAAFERQAEPCLETVIQLFEDAIDLGTLPFSILARHAFIGTAILKGLGNRGLLSADDVHDFQLSVRTIATDFIRDLDRYSAGKVPEDILVERYGHLRPGTYDILSTRYREQLGHLAQLREPDSAGDRQPSFNLDARRAGEMTRLLESEGYEVDCQQLFDYIRRAIQARELAKFCFTRNVSDALEVIAALGEKYGLSRNEISYVDIRQFVDAFIEPSGRSTESQLRAVSERGRERHEIATAIRLPSVITRFSDLRIVPLRVEQPNFITRKSVKANVVQVSGSLEDPTVIDGRIVAIQNADPGFDWIFTRPILGLITRFGGANSHMAIRCAEFGLPAAIGCGEQIFERAVAHGFIDLNCAEGQIRVGHLA